MCERAIYAGSFDPVTYGHIDLIKRAQEIFSKIIVAVAHNPHKRPLFSAKDRVRMLKRATSGFKGVVVTDFDGLVGTSMAAPHVAGLAALIMQARPGINAASVKDLIISTADLPAGTPASLPAIDATWNNRWGWGLVNAYEATDVKQVTDLTFPSHPPSPHWLSPDIITGLIRKDLNTTVKARIRNKGPNDATNVRVHFGVHVFSASTPTFYDIGTATVDIPVDPSGYTEVSVPWKPTDLGHQCIKVEIGYGPDSDYSNNTAAEHSGHKQPRYHAGEEHLEGRAGPNRSDREPGGPGHWLVVQRDAVYGLSEPRRSAGHRRAAPRTRRQRPRVRIAAPRSRSAEPGSMRLND